MTQKFSLPRVSILSSGVRRLVAHPHTLKINKLGRRAGKSGGLARCPV
jgi:hypothetical protein